MAGHDRIRGGGSRRTRVLVAITAGAAAAITAVTVVPSADLRPDITPTVGVLASGCSLIDSFGTGVAVAPDLIATSAHTVAGATEVTIIDHSGQEHSGRVVGFDPAQDVAVILVTAPLASAGLASTGKGDRGVLATWHPDTGFKSVEAAVSRLLVVTIEDIYLEELTKRRAFEISTEVVRGNSGGPVFNASGEVVGIIYATSRERGNAGFALRAEEISALVERVKRGGVANGRCT